MRNDAEVLLRDAKHTTAGKGIECLRKGMRASALDDTVKLVVQGCWAFTLVSYPR
jgi:hypothetical protein